MATSLLNRRARAARSSTIRDLLDQARLPGMISFAGGIPDPERFPVPLLADLAAGAIRDRGDRTLQYGPTAGESEARRALAGLYGPLPGGAGIDPDDLVVTSGAQQALDLVARVLLEPGDIVVCGQADYLGMLGVLSDHGAVAHPIPIDDAGLDVDRLASELRSGLRPRACYLVPHHHNPTGATITAERRLDLHRLSARYGFVVIEDDPYRALTYTGAEPVEAAADPDLTVRIRSTSKVLTPGLRVGALAGPRWLTEAVVIQKQSADLHTSSLSQALVMAAFGTGFLDDHVAGLRADYRAKLDIVVEALERRLADRVAFNRPSGGMFLWVRFPGIDTGQLLDRAIDHRVCFVPGQAFAVGTDLSDRARLSFVTASPGELVEGVDRLADALADNESPEASAHPIGEAPPAVAGIGS